MMSYQPPICDSGERLELLEECTVDRYKKIRKDGQVAKRERLGTVQDNGITILACPSCGKWYNPDFDEHDRLVRDGTYDGRYN